MKNYLLVVLLWLGTFSLRAYDPDSSLVHRVGNFIFEIEINGGKPTGFATLIDVRADFEPQGEITIPGSITVDGVRYVVNHIGDIYTSERFFEQDRAFRDLPGITRVNIPSTITSIGNMEFLGCTGINVFHVNVANKNFKDEDGILFYRWDEDSSWSLFRMPPARPKTQYTFPADVHRVEQCAFADNKTLRKIILSRDFMFNDPLWAWGNKSIREIDVTKNRWYDSSDGIIYASWGYGDELVACPPGLKLDSYTVPPVCQTIAGGAFCFSSVSKVILHDTVSLGGYVFAGSALEELECTAESLGPVSPDLCLMCDKLTKVHIVSGGHTPVSVGRFSFARCENLKEVRFDSDLVDIQTGAFYRCISLSDFPFANIVSMEGSDYMSSWEGRQFQGSGIRSVLMPSSVETVPEYCFRDCANLRDVHINLSDDGMTTYIGNGAFRNCKSLESIRLNKLKGVGGNAFVESPISRIIITERSKDDGEIIIGLSFDFFSDTRLYLDTSEVRWVSADGSGNNVPATFIVSSLEKSTRHVPNHWSHLYCVAGMKEWYDNNFHEDWGWGGPVTEMFSLKRSQEDASVIVTPNPEMGEVSFVVTGVSIGGVEAEKMDDNCWISSVEIGSANCEVRIRYKVDGVPMSTAFPADTTTSFPIYSDSPSEIDCVYSLSGHKLDADPDRLPSGIYIIVYTSGKAGKVIIP